MDSGPGAADARVVDAGTAPGTRVIVVAGFLGAGKTRIVRTLLQSPGTRHVNAPAPSPVPATAIARHAAGLGPDAEEPPAGAATAAATVSVIEASGLCDPRTLRPGLPPDTPVRVAVAADAVNLAAGLANPALAPLLTAQLRAAAIVVVSRGDVVDPTEARNAIRTVTGAPIIDPRDPGLCEAILAADPAAQTDPDPTDFAQGFRIWTYSGPTVMTADAAETLLRDRPAGTYRLKGRALTVGGGLDLQVFGRGRQIAPIDAPEATELVAIGPRPLFHPHEMDRVFAEAAIASAYSQGGIACR